MIDHSLIMKHTHTTNHTKKKKRYNSRKIDKIRYEKKKNTKTQNNKNHKKNIYIACTNTNQHRDWLERQVREWPGQHISQSGRASGTR